MSLRPLGRTGLSVSPIGFGAFKIGRNRKTKYPRGYDLPDETAVERLLDAVLEMGINFIDTAPAYGLSEERIGRCIAQRRREFVLSTKVGETFQDGRSVYDFSSRGIRESVRRSLRRLRTEVIDLLLIHSDGRDRQILDETDAVETVLDLKTQGLVRGVGLSAKTAAGARRSLEWADVLMAEYHLRDRSHEAVIAEASEKGLGVIVKKGLGSGHLSPGEAVPFVLRNPHVASLVVGSLQPAHLRSNLALAETAVATTALPRPV